MGQKSMISVVLIDLGSHRTSTLSAALADAGYRVSHVLAGDADVASEISAINPDAVLIAASSASRDSLEHLAFLSDDFPKPLFMILSQDDRKLQAAAADVGLSAYVVEGLSPALVRTLVEVSVQRFEREHSLMDELARTREELEQRAVVDRARCLLMERQGMTEKQAYQELRSAAMRRGAPRAPVAATTGQR